mgnify:CR=1 FL=1
MGYIAHGILTLIQVIDIKEMKASRVSIKGSLITHVGTTGGNPGHIYLHTVFTCTRLQCNWYLQTQIQLALL